MSLASTLQGMKRKRWDGNDFLTITYRQHRDSRKRFRFFDVQPILFELLHFLRFYRYKGCNHTWWEVVSRRQQKSGVTKHFFIPKKLGRFRVSKFLVWCQISLEQTQLWSPSFQCPVKHRKKERSNPFQSNRTAVSPPPVHPLEDRDKRIADDVLASFFRFSSPYRVNPVIAAKKPRHVRPMARCHLSSSPGCKVLAHPARRKTSDTPTIKALVCTERNKKIFISQDCWTFWHLSTKSNRKTWQQWIWTKKTWKKFGVTQGND